MNKYIISCLYMNINLLPNRNLGKSILILSHSPSPKLVVGGRVFVVRFFLFFLLIFSSLLVLLRSFFFPFFFFFVSYLFFFDLFVSFPLLFPLFLGGLGGGAWEFRARGDPDGSRGGGEVPISVEHAF